MKKMRKKRRTEEEEQEEEDEAVDEEYLCCITQQPCSVWSPLISVQSGVTPAVTSLVGRWRLLRPQPISADNHSCGCRRLWAVSERLMSLLQTQSGPHHSTIDGDMGAAHTHLLICSFLNCA